MDVRADTSEALATIRAQVGIPIAQELAKISQLKITKSFAFLRSLKCLSLGDGEQAFQPPKSKRRRVGTGLHHDQQHAADTHKASSSQKSASVTKLHERGIDVSHRDYVAVSYTWSPAASEDTASGGYVRVTASDPPEEIPCRVRDTVLKRLLSFAAYVRCPNIWIDKECIDQEDKASKEAAIQSMDLVYSLSDYPVALLSTVIEYQTQLKILADLLRGDFVSDGDSSQAYQFQLEESGVAEASAVLTFLDQITSDTWWSRAWTFQEDYKSSTKMTLLLPHGPTLESSKESVSETLGCLEGELCVNSADFRRASTEYCLAYQTRFGQDATCLKILRAAGKYNILLREPGLLGSEIFRSMSPTIFDDVGRRDIERESDRLAIVANCCSYAVRLETESLKEAACSLSLSMLALYLLNGEIMDNDGQKDVAALSDNIFGFLKHQSLDNFRPPVDQELTFIKSCRLPAVELAADGILTSGYLWKAGLSIQVRPSRMSQGANARDWSRPRKQLQDLADDLEGGKYGKSYASLANELAALATRLNKTFPLPYSDLIARELPDALDDGRSLYLAHLVRPGHHKSPYMALFVGEESEIPGHVSGTARHFFTATKRESHEFGSVDRHVSLEVEWQNHSQPLERPRLIVKQWVNGLYFPAQEVPREVLLPWPASLIV
jgi:hypothetical protein